MRRTFSGVYLHLGHVAQHAEDDKAGDEAGEAVDGARDNSILLHNLLSNWGHLLVRLETEHCHQLLNMVWILFSTLIQDEVHTKLKSIPVFFLQNMSFRKKTQF